jgi:trk system potassium uptake protein TrkH
MKALRDPQRLLVLGFAAAILLGGGLLALPIAHRAAPVGPLDALFTATSAVCVTGLTVVDTGTTFSLFGQAVILILIQIGGIGITTLSTAILLVAGQAVSLSSSEAVETSFAVRREQTLGGLLRRVIFWTLVIEAIGAAFLLAEESRRLPLGEAIWLSVFHAVSAFCNAGFSLRVDNLIQDRLNPGIVLPVSCLIVLGGLGFSVLAELAGRMLPNPSRWRSGLSLHTKIVVASTALLLVLGMAGFGILERNNLLRDAGLGEWTLTSLFASVTARTAGFNTVAYDQVTVATLYLTIGLMLIGGCPGSTAGGIKATTAAVLFAFARARLRGDRHVRLFHRGVPQDAIRKSIAVFVLAMLTVFVAVIALSAVEVGVTPLPRNTQWSLGLFFEVVSALGTVGLSTGITPGLSDAGKVILILLMFIGRLGPLTMAHSISRRRAGADILYAEERVMIG